MAAKNTEKSTRSLAWLLFIARRYVLTRRKNKSNTASWLSVGGLALGCAVLITVISVMNAFQLRHIDGILSFNSFQLRLDDRDLAARLAEPGIQERLKAASPGLLGVIPFFDIQVMTWGYYSQPEGMYLRGIDTATFLKNSGSQSSFRIIDGSMETMRPGGVILGRYLARYLNAVTGDQVSIMAFENKDGVSRPRQFELTVEGIMEVGYWDYDRYWGIISMETARQLSGGIGATSTGFWLADTNDDLRARARIEKVLSKETGLKEQDLDGKMQSWRSYNSALFGALRVEKLMMMVVIGLIFIVVAVNIFHALRRSVLEKTEDIGVLRALGAGPRAIQLIFIGEGLIIGGSGSLIGLVLGIALSQGIDGIFQALTLAAQAISDLLAGMGLTSGGGQISLFYMEHVPSTLYPGEAVGIAAFAFLSALVASWAASRRVSRIEPAAILRSE